MPHQWNFIVFVFFLLYISLTMTPVLSWWELPWTWLCNRRTHFQSYILKCLLIFLSLILWYIFREAFNFSTFQWALLCVCLFLPKPFLSNECQSHWKRNIVCWIFLLYFFSQGLDCICTWGCSKYFPWFVTVYLCIVWCVFIG